jgi:hypothetical protein
MADGEWAGWENLPREQDGPPGAGDTFENVESLESLRIFRLL